MILQIKYNSNYDKSFDPPQYQTTKASGIDLRACLVGNGGQVVLNPGEKAMIHTGLSFGIPENHEIQIRPRSGLSAKTGLRVANAPGTIDEDYTGEIIVIIHNLGKKTEVISHGDRVAQAVLCPIVRAELVIVEEIKETERGSGGFGSTGIN